MLWSCMAIFPPMGSELQACQIRKSIEVKHWQFGLASGNVLQLI